MFPLPIKARTRDVIQSGHLRVELKAQHAANLQVRERLRTQKEDMRQQRLDLSTVRRALSGNARAPKP